MYKVEWEDKAKESLKKIDQLMAKKITSRVESFLAKNPTEYGKPLTGNLKGKWRYRFSEYRVIYEIKQTKLLILVVKVGHRKDIYDYDKN